MEAFQRLRASYRRLTTREKLNLILGAIAISASSLLLLVLVLAIGKSTSSNSSGEEIQRSKNGYGVNNNDSSRLQNENSIHTNTNTLVKVKSEQNLVAVSKNLSLAELTELRQRNGVCETGDCKSLAHDLLNSMNLSMDPCTDFYEFICGQRLSRKSFLFPEFNNELINLVREPLTGILKEVGRMSSHNEIVPIKQATAFLHNCLNQTETAKSASLFELVNAIKSNGGWPMVSTHVWDEAHFDWMKISGTYEHEFASSPFLRVSTELDIKETSKHVIYINQPERLTPFTSITRELFRKYALLLANIVKTEKLTTDQPKIVGRNEELEELIDFMIELSKISAQTNSTKSTVDQAEENYNNFTLSSLQREFGFSMEFYLKKHVFRSKLELSSDEKIIVRNSNYLKQLFPLIQRTRSRTLANALHFYLFHNLAQGLISELSGFSSREVYCNAYVKHFFGLAAYYKISNSRWKSNINYNAEGSAIAKIHQMIETQREVFMNQISNSIFDPETETKARGKLAATRAFVGKPAWLTAEMVEEYYHELNATSDNHIGNLRELIAWQMRKQMKSLRRPPEEDTRLEMLASGLLEKMIQPSHVPAMNSFVIPDTILKPPFFSSKYPASINHGALGFILGHELTHGFDTEKLRFDASGNLGTWLSPASQEILNQKTTCFQKQYDEFQPIPGQHVNGTFTLNENLADNSGIAVALSAYQKYIQGRQSPAAAQDQQRLPGLEQFSHEQLFFIAFAHPWCEKYSPSTISTLLSTDTHSPARFRILGSLMNSQVFSKVWSCPIGSKMNPSRKCTTWNA